MCVAVQTLTRSACSCQAHQAIAEHALLGLHNLGDADSVRVAEQEQPPRVPEVPASAALSDLYFQPRHLGDEYVWDELEIVEVPGKGHGVHAKVRVPKGKCLPVYGVEIPDDPYPQDTRYIFDLGKKGAPHLLDVNPLHAPDHQRGLFIAGKVPVCCCFFSRLVAVYFCWVDLSRFLAEQSVVTGE